MTHLSLCLHFDSWHIINSSQKTIAVQWLLLLLSLLFISIVKMWLLHSCQTKQAFKCPVRFNPVQCCSYLSHRTVPGSLSPSSHRRSGSSPPCRFRCAGRGWTSTVWEALWSTRASHPLPSGPQPAAGCLCSARPQTSLWHSPRNRSSAEPSTPEEEATGTEWFHWTEFD